MTIKKTIKKTVVKKPEGGAAAGGAAIADRFKLAPAEPVQGAVVGKKAAMWALIAGLLALAASVILTYILYQHWEFLMPA